MPPLPSVTQTVTDGALGNVAAVAALTFALIGQASLPTVNTVYTLRSLQQVRTVLGYGPLAELAALVLLACGGRATLLCIKPTATAGSLVAGTQVGSGLGTVGDSSSAPNDDYDLVVKIVVAGAVATATFVYSLDGGRTWSSEIATAATYAIPNTGVTLAFSSGPGNFVAGDQYPFEVKGPSTSVSNLNTALDALDADGREFSLLHAVGIPTDAATCNSVAAALSTKLAALATKHRYAIAFNDPPEAVAIGSLRSAMTTTDWKVLTTFDFVPLTSVLSGRTEKRPSSWMLFARACQVPISVALHATDPTESGPLDSTRVARLKSLQGEAVTYSYHDEFTATTSADDGRIASLRTWPGETGVYIARARTLALLTSDFTELHRGRVMNEACSVAYHFVFKIVGKRLRVDRATGKILESEAKRIEAAGTARLRQALVSEGHASDASLVVDRDENILSTQKFKYRVRVLPLAHGNYLEGEFGFENPALATA
jgi:hypothetical protein